MHSVPTHAAAMALESLALQPNILTSATRPFTTSTVPAGGEIFDASDVVEYVLSNPGPVLNFQPATAETTHTKPNDSRGTVVASIQDFFLR